MAFSNTYDTVNLGSAVSNREDLADYISLLAPEDTPVLSALPRTSASAMYHEWTLDKLKAPSTAGVVEGSDVSNFDDKFSNLGRIGNRCQRLRNTWRVSKEQQIVAKAGISDLVSAAETKCIRELRRDVEATLCSNNDLQVGGETSAPLMRGLGDWIDSAGPADVPATYRTPAGSIHASGTLTEAAFKSLITSIYIASGDTQRLTLVADTALRAVVTDFALTSGATNAVYRQIVQNQTGTLSNTVGIYESDHGMITIVNMNPDCAPDTTNKDTGYLLNWDYLQLAELEGMGATELQDFGGGRRGYVDWMGTLVVKHPGALGKITVLS